MSDSTYIGDEQIDSPDAQNPENIRPGGDAFVSSEDEQTFIISFNNDDYDAAEVTEITISSVDDIDTGVESVQIWYKPEGSDTFVPYAPGNPAATEPQAIPVTDDAPIVLTTIDDIKLSEIKITVTRDVNANNMTFDIRVHACLHEGKSAVL